MSHTGLLFVGDGKMSALGTRAYVVGRQHRDLSPLPCTGATAEAMAAWISEGIAKDRDGALERLGRRATIQELEMLDLLDFLFALKQFN